MKKIAAYSLPLVILLFSLSLAGRMKHITEEIDADGAERIVLEVDLGAGEFHITTDDIAFAAVIDIEYNPRRTEYDISYEVKRSTGYLTLESSNRSHTNLDTDDNVWDIVLSTRYETSLNIEIGACEAEIDLGGIPLQELSIEVGAASGVIEFSKPNPTRLRELSIEAGASSLELISFGNANFDEFNFSGGVGSFELDLRGEYNGESEIEIEIGLGSADIILPLGVPIQVETENGNWLSTIDFHNDDLEEVDDGLYESDDFEDAETRIILVIEVGLGSIDLYWKN